MSTRKMVVAAVGALSVAQLGLAGVAYFSRAASEDAIVEEQQRLDMLEEQQQNAAEQPVVEVVEPEPVRWRLLDGPDVVATLQVLQGIGDAAGVSFDTQKALRAANPGKQPFVVTGRGTPEQVCKFLAAIETNDRLMVIETGRVLPASETQIAFELGLSTYHGAGQ